MSFRKLDAAKVDLRVWDEYLKDMADLKAKISVAVKQSDGSTVTVIDSEIADRLNKVKEDFDAVFRSWFRD